MRKNALTGIILTMGLAITTMLVVPTMSLSAPKTTVPEGEITIDGKKPARFDHQTHLKMKLDCGQCHHDAKHQPRDEAAIAAMANSDKLRCASCHNETFTNAKLQKPKQIFHARCRDCHKKGVGDKKGPTKCKGCHISAKKSKVIEGC